MNGKVGNLIWVKGKNVIWKNNFSQPKNLKMNINKIIDYSIDRKLIDFIEWFSNYNMVPIGLVLKMAIKCR